MFVRVQPIVDKHLGQDFFDRQAILKYLLLWDIADAKLPPDGRCAGVRFFDARKNFQECGFA